MPCHSKWPNLVRNRRFGQFEYHTPPISGHRIAKSWHESGDFLGDIAVICMKPDRGKRIACRPLPSALWSSSFINR
jgi:hypothetical protein